jgi:hypothetical protein
VIELKRSSVEIADGMAPAHHQARSPRRTQRTAAERRGVEGVNATWSCRPSFSARNGCDHACPHPRHPPRSADCRAGFGKWNGMFLVPPQSLKA